MNSGLAAEWHPTKNGSLTAYDVSAGSDKKVWWLCGEGHEWGAKVGSRSSGRGCSACAAKPKPGQSLAEVNSGLAAEWHPTKNGSLTAYDVSAGSGRKVWWLCGEGHEWEAKVSGRSRGDGCPACRAKPKPGQSLAEVNEDLAAQWHPTKNGSLTAYDVSAGSERKVWWLCGERHEWEARVYSRSGGKGCSACAAKPKPGQSLAEVNEDLAAQWHPTKNGALTAYDVSAGSSRKVWWLCGKRHEWETTVGDRSKGSGCSACPPKPKPGQSLAEVNEDLAAQWHPTKNGALTAYDVSVWSGRKVWWLCGEGHEWEAKVSGRSRGDGCSACHVLNNNIWTRGRAKEFAETLSPGAVPAKWAMVAAWKQNALTSKHGADLLNAIAKGTPLPGTEIDSDDSVGTTEAHTGETGAEVDHRDAGPSTEIDVSQEDLEIVSPDLETDDSDSDPDDESDRDLPSLRAEKVLAGFEHARTVSPDEELVNFMLSDAVATLWREAYREDIGETVPGPGESVFDVVRSGELSENQRVVADEFLAQHERASAITPPAGWSFVRRGEPIVPNLMQKHFASLVLERRRVGNWSGTGAGKTLSAVLAARLAEAGMPAPDGSLGKDGLILVLCPNNTVSGWESTIAGAYRDNRVATKTLDPTWSPGSGPRWLVVNYDRLQDRAAEDALSRLLERFRLNMVVIDEVHFSKFREGTESSQRRETISHLLAEAGRENPGMYVLGMSATPVINDLSEGKSILELVTGEEMHDLKTKRSIVNAILQHAQFVLHGVRWLPRYKARLERPRRDRIDVTDRLEALVEASRSDSQLQIEQILVDAKLPTIVDDCLEAHEQGRRTLVYTELVDGIVDPIKDALEDAGLRVGVFTGQDKTGLSKFLGIDSTGAGDRPLPESERVDVLIGSSAIGTGVDGLQDVASHITFATLPWTAASYTQVIGRIWRQGQKAGWVSVSAPTCFVATPDSEDGRDWSYDDQRWARIQFKRTLSDAVMDGEVGAVNLETQKQLRQRMGDWLERILTGDLSTIERRPLTGELRRIEVEADEDSTHGGRQRRFGRLAGLNSRWNRSASAATHRRLYAHPEEWHLYHRIYREARETWDTVPAHVFADWLQERTAGKKVADLGCGEMILADRVAGRHDVRGFDHVAIDDRVTVCDIANVPASDGEFDYAILSLALMGSNHADYVAEAHRILAVDGQLWIAETRTRIGDDEDRIRTALAENGFALTDMSAGETFILIRATRLPAEAIANPVSLLLQSEQDESVAA